MAVKRSKRKSKAKTRSEVYEQAMAAEGAPVALDFLGLGSTIGDLIRGKKAAKPRAKKKARAKTKTARAKKKSPARKSRRKN